MDGRDNCLRVVDTERGDEHELYVTSQTEDRACVTRTGECLYERSQLAPNLDWPCSEYRTLHRDDSVQNILSDWLDQNDITL